MSKLRPNDAQITLIYKCPQCDYPHYLQIKETVWPGKIHCVCDAKLLIEPIKSVDIKALYKNETIGTTTSNSNFMLGRNKPRHEIDILTAKLVPTLVSLGYQRNQALKLVQSAHAEFPKLSEQELLFEIMKVKGKQNV